VHAELKVPVVAGNEHAPLAQGVQLKPQKVFVPEAVAEAMPEGLSE
jgi:hypothetical protein